MQSYIESHQAPGRGESYDAYYATDPNARYLWQQEQRVLTRLLKEFYSGRAIRLLDFACGTGRITAFLENRVASSYGVDVSAPMLAVARQKLARTTLLQANLLQQSPFPPQSFNLVCAFRFFLNAEPELRSAALRALAPLLTHDGCFVFNIHQNKHSLYYWPTAWYCRLRQLQPHRTLGTGQCATLLKQAGLRVCRVYPVGLLHLPKLRFPAKLQQSVDGWATPWSALGRISDSPIIVARKVSKGDR